MRNDVTTDFEHLHTAVREYCFTDRGMNGSFVLKKQHISLHYYTSSKQYLLSFRIEETLAHKST